MRSSLAILSLWICLNVDATPLIVCPELPKVENAQISPASVKTSYIPGDRIEYSCDNGYTSLRKIQYVCSENKWAKIREVECTPKRCEQPADILNGKYILQSGNSFVVGTTIKYICNNGFQMMSRIDTRTCRHGGWDNQLPVCEEVVCVADIPDRRIKVEGTLDYGDLMRPGHRLQFSCEQGDILRGHKEIICQSNGEWNHPFPKCEEVACLLNNTEDIKVERIPNQEGLIKPGHQIKLSCVVHGLIIKGKKEITCQADGEWSSPFPKCEEATCVANLTNMIVERGHDPVVVIYKPGDNLKVSCIRGRRLILQGENSITCRDDGEWSSPFPKCVVKPDCERPPTMGHKNADTEQMLDSRKTEYKSGEKVKYVCFSKYTIDGDPYLTCVQGNWEGNFTCIEACLASVEEMDQRNIQLQKGGRERMYCPHKDHITFVCQRGKYPKGIYASLKNLRFQCLYGIMTLPECE